jgi:3-deoxy-manno-octulosonate cytidylyltransferase (CMP-KDO synthetase)
VFTVVIPARFGSTRLPGKALVSIAGKPMLQWVYERARASKARDVFVATDDERIAKVAQQFGASVVMTDASHASGTDRIAEVSRTLQWPADEIVVNLQGDEPLMPPALINQVAEALERHASAAIATLAAPILSIEEFLDPNAVKVVTDRQGRALYFSRAPIPWDRDGAASGGPTRRSYAGARRHLGLYAYRVGALQSIAALPPTALELCEKLEQLRALENGFEIRLVDAAERPGQDVNTPADLERVITQLAQKS